MQQSDKDMLRKILRNNKTPDVLKELAEFQFREYKIDMKRRNDLVNMARQLEEEGA